MWIPYLIYNVSFNGTFLSNQLVIMLTIQLKSKHGQLLEINMSLWEPGIMNASAHCGSLRPVVALAKKSNPRKQA